MLDSNFYIVRSARTDSAVHCTYFVKVGEVPGLTPPNITNAPLPPISFPSSPIQNAERILSNAKAVISNPTKAPEFQNFPTPLPPVPASFVKNQPTQQSNHFIPPQTQRNLFISPQSQQQQQPQWKTPQTNINFIKKSPSPAPLQTNPNTNFMPPPPQQQNFTFQQSSSPMISQNQQYQPQPQQQQQQISFRAPQSVSFTRTPLYPQQQQQQQHHHHHQMMQQQQQQQTYNIKVTTERAIEESTRPVVFGDSRKRFMLENLISTGTSPAGAAEAIIKYGIENQAQLYEYSEMFKRFECEGFDKSIICEIMSQFYPDEGTVRFFLSVYSEIYRDYRTTIQEFLFIIRCVGPNRDDIKKFANAIMNIKKTKPNCTMDDIDRGLKRNGLIK